MSKTKKTNPRHTSGVTPVLVALDRSGSMYGVVDDVIGGFNAYIADLKADPDNKYRVTLIIFDTEVTTVFEGVDAADVPPLTDEVYKPRGGTALLDAIGALVSGYKQHDGDMYPLVVTHTDGKENSSLEWRTDRIKALVEERTTAGWGFVFLGAGLDNWQQGMGMGMSAGRTVNSSWGTRGLYEGLATGTRDYAAGLTDADGATRTASKFSERRDREAREWDSNGE